MKCKLGSSVQRAASQASSVTHITYPHFEGLDEELWWLTLARLVNNHKDGMITRTPEQLRLRAQLTDDWRRYPCQLSHAYGFLPDHG